MEWSRLGGRSARRFPALLGGLWMFACVGGAAAGDKLTEANMTQKDYERLTKTESSVENEPPTAPPTPIHNISDRQEVLVTTMGATKVIPGKDWKHESPEERDAHIRRIKQTLPEGAHLVVTVPKGDVWIIPPSERNEETGAPADWKYITLVLGGTIRDWTEAEIAALPKTVARDKSISQSDKHGTTPIRAAAPEPEED